MKVNVDLRRAAKELGYRPGATIAIYYSHDDLRREHPSLTPPADRPATGIDIQVSHARPGVGVVDVPDEIGRLFAAMAVNDDFLDDDVEPDSE